MTSWAIHDHFETFCATSIEWAKDGSARSCPVIISASFIKRELKIKFAFLCFHIVYILLVFQNICMYDIKAGVLERVEQTFQIVFSKKNFLILLLPLVIYKVGSFLSLSYLEISVMNSVMWDAKNISEVNTESILSSTALPLFIVLYSIITILFSLIYICVNLWIIKTSKEILLGNELKQEDNFMYWVEHFLRSMYSYYYYFMYVFIIPSLVFIIWWCILIYALQNGWKESGLFDIAIATIVWGTIIGGWIAVYKSIKATFFLSSAIDKEDFSRENFQTSTQTTDGNWWRILWNLLLIGIIVSLCTSMITGAISSFTSIWWSTSLLTKILSNPDLLGNPSGLQNIVNSLEAPSLWILQIISGAVNQWIQAIAWGFTIVFTYLFFKRLEQEKNEALK